MTTNFTIILKMLRFRLFYSVLLLISGLIVPNRCV